MNGISNVWLQNGTNGFSLMNGSNHLNGGAALETNTYLTVTTTLSHPQNAGFHFERNHLIEKKGNNDPDSKSTNFTISDSNICCAPRTLHSVLPSSSHLQIEDCPQSSNSLPFHQLRKTETVRDAVEMSFDPSVKRMQAFPSWRDVQDLIEAGNNQTDSGAKKSESAVLKRRKAKTAVQVKDDRYWERRKKNNLAAKKSREAKRERETTKQKRAMLLQIENTRLRLELSWLREQNSNLKQRFAGNPYASQSLTRIQNN